MFYKSMGWYKIVKKKKGVTVCIYFCICIEPHNAIAISIKLYKF